MSNLFLPAICLKVEEAAREAGNYIATERSQFTADKVEVKSLNSLVSYVDRGAEELIIKRLKDIVPGAGIITEEETIQSTPAEYMWVIDPLDGTTNVIHGIPCFCVSIALVKNKVPI